MQQKEIILCQDYLDDFKDMVSLDAIGLFLNKVSCLRPYSIYL